MSPLLHLDTVTAAPKSAIVLAAMARPPAWVRRITTGRPYGACYADTKVETDLMLDALAERANPLLGYASGCMDRYRAAMEAKFERFAKTGVFMPGAFNWTEYEGRWQGVGSVPDGAWLVCTCKPAQGCHLRWLAPYLARAGWDVRLYGQPLGEAP